MKKYLDNGKMVWVTRELNPGFLVQDYYETDGYCEEPYICEKEYFVEKVHCEAPTEKYDKEIDELTAEISRLRETKRTMRARIKEIEQEVQVQVDKYKDHPDLKLLDQFVNNKITHYAILGRYNMQIIEFGKATCENWTGELKLLTLFGGNKGDLEWKLNRYTDGSGNSLRVAPCLSYEHAQSELQKFIEGEIDPDRPEERFIKCAERYNLNISQDYINEFNRQVKERKREKIKEHKGSIRKLEKELRA
jgi:DNA-binding transcriptional regulator GbsR (MarR family)